MPKECDFSVTNKYFNKENNIQHQREMDDDEFVMSKVKVVDKKKTGAQKGTVISLLIR